MLNITRKSIFCFAIIALAGFMGCGGPYSAASDPPGQGAELWGTWYLALDTTPFGIPGGTLPALFTFHRDGTWLSSDGGDLASNPFTTLDTAQHGAWVDAGNGTFVATSLFLQKDTISGDLTSWHRVRIALQFVGNDFDQMKADVTEQVLPCDASGPTPFLLFNCPNPITTEFPPAPVPDVPASLTRLRPN